MRYLFVDRILDAGRDAASGGKIRGAGLKAICRTDPFLRPAPGGGLELSPSFLGEAIGQLAAWIAMSRSGFVRRPVAGLTAEAEALGRARAGDLVGLEVEIESLEEDAVSYNGRALVQGEPVLVLRHSVGPMLPMEEFDDPKEVERRYRDLLRAGDGPEDALGAGGVRRADADWSVDRHPAIDAVLDRSEDRIAALTCISRNAPYLADHFPRQPVFPATLLFDAQVALGLDLLPGARVLRLKNLKMRDFIRPGARLLSEVRIKEDRGGTAILQLTGRLGERTVSSGLLELALPEARA